LFTFVLLSLSLPLKASPAKADKNLKVLARSFGELKDSKLVEMQVQKEFSSPYMAAGKAKVSDGKFHFSRGKIRLSFDKPNSSLLVLSGADIWLEERHPKTEGELIQVSHFKADKAKKSSALLALLFGESKIWNELELE